MKYKKIFLFLCVVLLFIGMFFLQGYSILILKNISNNKINVNNDTLYNSNPTITEKPFDTENELIVKEWDKSDVIKRIEDIKEGWSEMANSVYVIPDGKTAKQFADLVMESTFPESKEKYKEVEVYYNSKYEIWIVMYSRNSDATIGEGMSVYLSKKTGEVLAQCPGE